MGSPFWSSSGSVRFARFGRFARRLPPDAVRTKLAQRICNHGSKSQTAADFRSVFGCRKETCSDLARAREPRRPPPASLTAPAGLSSRVKQNSFAGLAATYDALAVAYPETVDALAEKMKYTAGAMSALHENYVCNFSKLPLGSRAARARDPKSESLQRGALRLDQPEGSSALI